MKVGRALGIWANNMYARGGHAFDGHYNPPVRVIESPLMGLISLIANLISIVSMWVITVYSIKTLMIDADNIFMWIVSIGFTPLALLNTAQAIQLVEVIDEI